MEIAIQSCFPLNQPARSLAVEKLRLTAQGLRWLSAGYAAWSLWRILSWWLDAERVARQMSSYLQRDLSGMASWQPLAALGLDLLALGCLLAAVAYCWMFLGHLRSSPGFTGQGASQLMRCAWLAIACEAAVLLFRPMQSWLLTAHLGDADRLYQWQFRPADLQAIILCGALLMFALVYLWALETAEENKGFV